MSVSLQDFASRRPEETAILSHDSGDDHRRFQLCLDHETQTKLATLPQTFYRLAAEVIRQLIAHATPEDFPQRWQLTVEQRSKRRGETHEQGHRGT